MNTPEQYQTITVGVPDPEPNIEWHLGDNFVFFFTAKDTKLNRFKWWISTKLFLPGYVKWK